MHAGIVLIQIPRSQNKSVSEGTSGESHPVASLSRHAQRHGQQVPRPLLLGRQHLRHGLHDRQGQEVVRGDESQWSHHHSGKSTTVSIIQREGWFKNFRN